MIKTRLKYLEEKCDRQCPNEIALSSAVCIEIREDIIPVREEVKGACEILGLDPLYVANEGKLLALVSSEAAEPSSSA